jgi:hypothetical protein
MRRPLRALLVATAAVVAAAPGAAAQDAPSVNIQIERDLRPRTSIVASLSVAYRVTVTDAATGHSPSEGYLVAARATNADGEESEFFACGRVADVDSRTPPGVFDCTVIVDHGGAWEFVAVVSQEREEGQPAVPIAQNRVPFELNTTQSLVGISPGTEVSGGPGDVLLLLGHTAVAAAWFAGAAMLALLGVPALRRRLSVLGCHLLERRLDSIVQATWATAGLTVASGAYLTLTQAAYDPPNSPSEVEEVFDLPYGKPYFLTLALKITLYLMMMAASVPLVREARRRMLSPVAPPEALDPYPGGSGAAAGTAVAVRPVAAPVERPASNAVRLGVAAVVAGGAGVWVCVTLLKYFHELVEASRALL